MERQPLSNEERQIRPNQFRVALAQLKAAEFSVWLKGEHVVDYCGGGKAEKLPLDRQVLRGMGGGIQRMYQDMCEMGLKESADLWVNENRVEGKI